jgi:hypothetical protein
MIYYSTPSDGLDRKIVVVGDGKVKIMVEDGKCRLICAKKLLKLVEVLVS